MSGQHVKLVILCLVTVRIAVVALPDDLWWKKYSEGGDYDQLMQEGNTGKKKYFVLCRKVICLIERLC